MIDLLTIRLLCDRKVKTEIKHTTGASITMTINSRPTFAIHPQFRALMPKPKVASPFIVIELTLLLILVRRQRPNTAEATQNPF